MVSLNKTLELKKQTAAATKHDQIHQDGGERGGAAEQRNAGGEQLDGAIKSHSSEQNTERRAAVITCANEAII